MLIRHAKSSWEAPLRDIDRPLDHKGINDAHLISANCNQYIPSTYVIWSSSAKRTQETAMIFAQNILYPIESIVFNEELYTFDECKLENVIKSCDNSIESIILFGHNDAITNFVNKFGDVFIGHVPTAGFVWLKFDTDNWGEINNGKIKKTIFPKNLK
jgi:phosphohistidine phosphatase